VEWWRRVVVVVVVRGLKTEMTSGRAIILMLVIILSLSSINNSKQHRDRNRIWFVFNLFSTCAKNKITQLSIFVQN
jgi:hypothetical protein